MYQISRHSFHPRADTTMTMNTRKRRKKKKSSSRTVRKSTMKSSLMRKKTKIKRHKYNIRSTKKMVCPHKSNCHCHITMPAISSP